MALIRVVQELSFARDLGSVQEIVRTAARRLTGADGATFVLRENGKCFYADEDAIAPLWKGMRFPMESCISGWAMLNRRAAVVADVFADPRIPAEIYRPTFVRSLAMVPIRSLDPVGAIGVYWASPHAPTEKEVRTIQALADTTAVAMENVRIYTELEVRVLARTRELEAANAAIRNLSLQDELTGLHNRRGFNLLAEQSRRAAHRAGMDQFVVYLDADGLKSVNDSRGHLAGDEFLARLGRVLRKAFRDADVVARMGGDEFCVLGTATMQESVIADRLQAAFAEANTTWANDGLELKASYGIALWPADSNELLEAVLQRADQAMYRAKHAARSAPRFARDSLDGGSDCPAADYVI